MSPNNQDMYRMQQDALRRVWQMQEQARRSVENQTPEPESKQGSTRQQSSQKESNPQKKRENPPSKRYTRAKHPLSPKPSSPGDLIGMLTGGDNEKSLILVLLVLLINEKADTSLILAMLYLLI